MTRKNALKKMEYFIYMANRNLESKIFYQAMHYYEYALATARLYNEDHERVIFLDAISEEYAQYLPKLSRFMDRVSSILYESSELREELY